MKESEESMGSENELNFFTTFFNQDNHSKPKSLF